MYDPIMTKITAQPDVNALVKTIAQLDNELFHAYRGGWPNDVGAALVDAVYSIQAQYDSDHPDRGVLNRVKKLRAEHPAVTDDLSALVALGESDLKAIMGDGRTAQRYKSECVIEAAERFLALEPPVKSSTDFTTERVKELKQAYTSVRGLGHVTFDYLAMHLGVPGVKADTLLTRFVARYAYGDEKRKLSSQEVIELVKCAWEVDQRGAENITHFEHALWRAESTRR